VTGRSAFAVAAAVLAVTPLLAAASDDAAPRLAIVTVEAGGASGVEDGAASAIEDGGGSGAEVATGFTTGGLVVTVAHLVETSRGRLSVVGEGGARLPASVVRLDAAADLAYLTATRLRPTPAPPVAGVRVLVRRAGRTVALPAAVRRRISATVTDTATGVRRARPALELAATIEAGDSGAPVVAPGRVLGVVFARSATRAGTAYAVALPASSAAASR
jgi:hypothetical protein